MNILSSTAEAVALKFQLIDSASEEVLAKGLCRENRN